MAKKLPVFETPFDTYSTIKNIGEGGSGRVYEVKNNEGQIMALKCLSPSHITADRLKRFKNEISFCQQSNHTNIVRVLDAGSIVIDEKKCPFYVMKRYSGTLRSHMATGLNPEAILRAYSQVLDGVEAAHFSQVRHRDLKPENILWDENSNSLVVADFGIAHFEQDEIYTAVETKVASRMANFQYSAPEQRTRGAIVDHRSDIFALGLILNEMFTGSIPQGAGYKRIGDLHKDYAYLDSLVELMIQQDYQKRVGAIEEIKKELIGRKLSFVALQKHDALSKQTTPVAVVPDFKPISIVALDYNDGVLTLELSSNAPSGWSHEFHNPRGGHSSMLGYGPETFQIRGKTITRDTRGDPAFIQQLVDHIKKYIQAANRGYEQQITEMAQRQEWKEREDLEKRVADAQLRTQILSNIKF